MKSNYLNQNNSKFINYNEAVDKILEYSEKPIKIKKNIRKNISNKQKGHIKKKDGNNPVLTLDNKNNSGIPFPHTGSSLFLQKAESSDIFSIPRDKTLLSGGNNNYLNFFNNYNNNYNASNLSLMKNDSRRSFYSNSSINEQNN